MSHVKYKETQRFSKYDVYAITAGLAILGLVRLIQVLVSGSGDIMRIIVLSAGVVLTFGIIVYLMRLRMTARFNEKNIKVTIFPFGLRQRKIKWKHVVEARIIDPSPAFAWSGWNVHFDSLHKMFNVNGKSLLFLRLENGESISIGCKSREELENFLLKAKEFNPAIAIG